MIWGDPHYISLDKRKYNFQGDCDYTILTPLRPDAEGVADFHLWGDNIKVRRSRRVAKLRKVYLDYMEKTYSIGQSHEIFVGRERMTSPVYDAETGVRISYSRPITVCI